MKKNTFLTKIKNNFLLKKPYALTHDGWEQWAVNNKKKYPIRYFLQETFMDYLRKYFLWPLERVFVKKLYWGFKYRFIKKHQYNIIRPTTLKPGYYDPVELMIHSCFHLLVEYVDFQRKEGLHIQTFSWNAAKEWYSIIRLYEWWKNERPYREDTLKALPDGPPGAPDMWIFSDRYINTPEYKEWSDVAKEHRQAEYDWELEDEQKLIELVKLREKLWY